MRKKRQKQMPLMPTEIDHPQAHELESISRIINRHPTICDHVMRDLHKGRPVNANKGAKGMTAEQAFF